MRAVFHRSRILIDHADGNAPYSCAWYAPPCPCGEGIFDKNDTGTLSKKETLHEKIRPDSDHAVRNEHDFAG